MRSAGVQQRAGWLVENGLRELDLLFRAVLYHPSQPILIADSDRKYLDANSGAGRLLGLSRDQIIGRRIDDFAEPSFRPQIDRLCQDFLEQGEQEGTFPLLGPHGDVREVDYTAKGNILPVQHLFVLHDKSQKKVDEGPGSSWVKDYAFFLLDPDGRIAACYSGAERIYGYKDKEIIGQDVCCLYPGEENLRFKLQGE